MKNVTKKFLVLGLFMAFATSLFARSYTESIDMYDSYFEWGRDLNLEQLLENNNYHLRFDDLKIENVTVYLRGHGNQDRVRVIVGDFNQYFDIYRDDYYQRIEARIPSYFRQNSREWRLRIEGFVTIDRIDITLFDRNNNWNNEGPNHPTHNNEFVQLNRFFSQKRNDHNITSSRYVDQGYKFESQVGQIFSNPEPGTQELYECLVNGRDHMLSTNSVCEGTQLLGIAGFIHTSQVPNTKPLYRCLADGKDHFASLDGNCEGKTREGVLGYIY